MSNLALVSREGFGSPGYCTICACSVVDDIDAKFDQGWTVPQVQRWLARHRDDKGQPVTVDRRVLYKHRKEHIGNPRDRIVSFVERAKKRGQMTPATVSPEQFLSAVTAVGMQRVIDSPDDITIKDALAAAKAQMARPEKVTNLAIIMADVLNIGQPQRALPEIIEGEVL